MTDRKLIRNSTAEFLIFTAEGGEESIEVRYEDGTIWLSQRMMAVLFNVNVRTINEHLKNIFEAGELAAEATIRNFRIVQSEGNREVTRSIDHYNLDGIISVGYRVNSRRATQFRQWATSVLQGDNRITFSKCGFAGFADRRGFEFDKGLVMRGPEDVV